MAIFGQCLAFALHVLERLADGLAVMVQYGFAILGDELQAGAVVGVAPGEGVQVSVVLGQFGLCIGLQRPGIVVVALHIRPGIGIGHLCSLHPGEQARGSDLRNSHVLQSLRKKNFRLHAERYPV